MGRRLRKFVNEIIAIVDPRRAALREHFHKIETDDAYREMVWALMGARGYRAAAASSSSTPWTGGQTTADAEIRDNLPAMRNRSRELHRDDPIGSGLTATIVRNVIGTGLRPQAKTADPPINAKLEAVWNERRDRMHLADDLTAQEAQSLILRKVIEDGEVLLRQAKRAADDPLWFELIEADRLSNPIGRMDGQIASGASLRDGVERDPNGIPIAYWICRGQQGDIAAPNLSALLSWDRVPAGIIRHLRVIERPGQTRGVPYFHAILQDIHDLDLLILASLKRVQIAACLAAFIKSPQSVTDLLDVTAQKYGVKLNQDIEPGMMFKLFPDEEVQTLVPNFPTPELAPFIIMLARRIGAAVGVSWQVVLKDFSESTYSSARTDLLESRQFYTWLQNWFAQRCLTWQWSAVMLDAQMRGDPRLTGLSQDEFGAVEWVGDGWQWIDPETEVNAMISEVKSGFTTFDEMWRRLGKDPETMARMVIAETPLRELIFGSMQPETAASAASNDASDEDGEDGENSRAAPIGGRRITMKGNGHGRF